MRSGGDGQIEVVQLIHGVQGVASRVPERHDGDDADQVQVVATNDLGVAVHLRASLAHPEHAGVVIRTGRLTGTRR